VDPNAVSIAQASYDRCRDTPEFFYRFYANFFADCPEAQSMFANTDFDRQHKLLRHAIGLLLSFNSQSGDEPTILSRVAERHSRGDLAVDPSLYPFFVDSLIKTLHQLDPEFTADTEAAWRAATAKGIAYMQAQY